MKKWPETNRRFLVAVLLLSFYLTGNSQDYIDHLGPVPGDPGKTGSVALYNRTTVAFEPVRPLFTMLVDSIPETCNAAVVKNDTTFFRISDSLTGWIVREENFRPGEKFTVRFTNKSGRTRTIENLVPLGQDPDHVFITADGSKEWPGYLCRSKLFRPGFGPVGVVLPDNAWHLGFSSIPVNDTLSLTALARRGKRDTDRTSVDRWKLTLKPGGWAEYSIWFACNKGGWQEGMNLMFNRRWLYDLPEFDNTMFRRSDLAWMKESYIMLLQFAWDKDYYDPVAQKHTFYENLFKYDSLTGGYDIFTLWPTWPRLGLDQRNQWDMYRDLPGGLAELRKQADFTHKTGKKYFISYNPWDEGTRKEDQYKGMEELLRATDADGVVLDTKGSSSFELQATADRVRPGIIMYSEGMAVPKDMPGIVSGRVHDALVMPPPINLNKLIKPDFAIFRVLQLADDRLHRELAISFFNGYGVEINTMRPGRPEWIREEYAYLGRTTRLLRENRSVFTHGWSEMLVPALADSIWVNCWDGPSKRIFTIYSANPKGCHGPLFEFRNPSGNQPASEVAGNYHYVDLWNHEEIIPAIRGSKVYLPANIDAFDPSWLHSRKEGSAGCIAVFTHELQVKFKGGKLAVKCSPAITRIVITGKNPTYSSKQFEFPSSGAELTVQSLFGRRVDKIVIQAFIGSELIDERVIRPANAEPWLLSNPEPTDPVTSAPAGMMAVPGGPFRFYTHRDPTTQEPFIALPDYSDTVAVEMASFFMDRYPVTNDEYLQFVRQSNYIPKDTCNYLKHWLNGLPAKGTGNQPVVFISPEDANAYARWAGKRLPTEQEWQYAAQGTEMLKYPWGNKMDSARCNFNLNHPTPVNAYKKGAGPFGIVDMVGNVWQMTADVYDNGVYRYQIIRGGSYYHPKESIWYVTGGPLPADHPEMLLLIAPGLDRNATVGFRCVKDRK